MQSPPSLWWSQIESTSPRHSLRGDVDVDVAIVGGGYTGLWTARELLRRDPHLRVCVLESQICGFGASGRNGGWVSALFPAPAASVIERYGLDSYTRQRLLLQEAVATLGNAAREEDIECDFVQGGTLSFARSPLQEVRARDYVADNADHGVDEEDLRWIEPAELKKFAWLDGARGAVYSPHCARIQPARLVRGLANAIEHRGATIYENTPVTKILRGNSSRRAQAMTLHGTVRADYVVRATEGFTPTMPGQRRNVVPLYSLMIATSPLPEAWWAQYGFDTFPTFSDERHLLVYGQRTADNRLAFGGRGSPYHFGSTVEPRYDANTAVFSQLSSSLRELFPTLDLDVTHRWGGPLAMPRSKFPFVTVDHDSGMASAGGYTGDGVTLSYVCANALADLIVTPGVPTPHSSLPFVHSHVQRWEVEPLRWLGINAGIALATWADHHETIHGRTSRASALLTRLMGA
ncbi:MAG: FAD-dependent oxidoreductase [Acidimicrobiaceae bacterium]|nr:FAD-dependent oxidoreductase [Acidimicrobiaceae bacterium]